MLDEIADIYSDFHKMIKKCKPSDFKQEYKDLIVNNISELYKMMRKRG